MRRATGDDAASVGADLPPIDKCRIVPDWPTDHGAHRFGSPTFAGVTRSSETSAVPRSRHRSNCNHAANAPAAQAEPRAGKGTAIDSATFACNSPNLLSRRRQLQPGSEPDPGRDTNPSAIRDETPSCAGSAACAPSVSNLATLRSRPCFPCGSTVFALQPRHL